jgi:16S rRNA (guanine966-N2)-methyltransferase
LRVIKQKQNNVVVFAMKKSPSGQQGQIRIIAGQWRGRKLPVLLSQDLRPTGDRIRETLFNWLQFEWEGSAWLDAFAGSGALGFEALSRGADRVVMLEQNRKVAQQLQANVQLLKANSASIIETDTWQWLTSAPVTPFEGIFLDPPFREETALQSLCQLIKDRGWLTAQGYLYIEQPKTRQLSLDGWVHYRHQQTGDVQFGLWKLAE